jgi:DNA invertase Pin-like site-specific DNA recombinase
MFSERPKEVTARHLNGEAAIYGRQSTKKQDEENQGSLEFQRAQRRYSETWGVPDERIVPYEDRGLTGAASEHRPRFLAMLEGITTGRITMVFASDQSRLARNAIEWFKFLNLCRSHDVLLVLNGRIIRLNDGGDGFSSRIVALVDEYDLETRRGHVLRGIEGRLKDEKAVTAPPSGYVSATEKERKGEWDPDPDPAVQAAIYAIFRVFLEERSCARTVRRFISEGIEIPARKPGKPLYWVLPSIGAVRRFLKNRAYCGDYVYRQRVCDPTRGRNKHGHWRVRVATHDEMRVIENHHAAYISR